MFLLDLSSSTTVKKVLVEENQTNVMIEFINIKLFRKKSNKL